MRTYTPEQVEALLRPIRRHRVARNQGQSHVEAYEIAAHLTRIFGFPPAWRKEIISLECIEEHCDPEAKSGSNVRPGYWAVYLCKMRLWVYGEPVADDVATGDSSNQVSYGDAHDMAVKTAVSQALKRCAKDLGDQFGLSLYRKGSLDAVVGKTLGYGFTPESSADQPPDVEAHAPETAPEQEDRPADPETGEASEPDSWPDAPGPGEELVLIPAPAARPVEDVQADLGGQVPSASTAEHIAEVRQQIDDHVMMNSKGQLARIMGQAGRVWKGKTRAEIDAHAQAFCIDHVAELGLPKRTIASRTQLTHQEAEDIIGRLLNMTPEAGS